MQDTYRLVSGIVFGIVSILQLLRAVNGWLVQIGPFAVPLWFSWTAFVVAGALCAWAFRAQRR
jgi:hypothetical protein